MKLIRYGNKGRNMRTPQESQDIIDALEKEITEKNARILELEKFKEEQSQISCAYCGQLCARDVDELVKHIENCEKHPVFRLINEKIKLEKQNVRMKGILNQCADWKKSYDDICELRDFNLLVPHCEFLRQLARGLVSELEGKE